MCKKIHVVSEQEKHNWSHFLRLELFLFLFQGDFVRLFE